MQNFIGKEKQTHIRNATSKPDNEFSAFLKNTMVPPSYNIPYPALAKFSSVGICTGSVLPIQDCKKKGATQLTSETNDRIKSDRRDFSSVFIKMGNKLVKVMMDSILYMYTDTKNYCSLVTTDNKKLSVRSSIQGLYKLLDKDIFVQSHRSYIINWKRVDTIYETDQTLEINGHHIPIGRTYRKNIYSKLNIL